MGSPDWTLPRSAICSILPSQGCWRHTACAPFRSSHASGQFPGAICSPKSAQKLRSFRGNLPELISDGCIQLSAPVAASLGKVFPSPHSQVGTVTCYLRLPVKVTIFCAFVNLDSGLAAPLIRLMQRCASQTPPGTFDPVFPSSIRPLINPSPLRTLDRVVGAPTILATEDLA